MPVMGHPMLILISIPKQAFISKKKTKNHPLISNLKLLFLKTDTGAIISHWTGLGGNKTPQGFKAGNKE